MADTVETTAVTPSAAASSDAASFRSPSARSIPSARSASRLAGSDVVRTRPRTFCPALASRRATAPPTTPVAPATRIMVSSSRFLASSKPTSNRGFPSGCEVDRVDAPCVARGLLLGELELVDDLPPALGDVAVGHGRRVVPPRPHGAVVSGDEADLHLARRRRV